MTNNENTRLDQFVKDSLNSYEQPYNEADWADMEKRLDGRPPTGSFRKWSFSMNTIIGLVAVGAVAFGTIYVFSGSSTAGTDKNTHELTQPVKNQQPVSHSPVISTGSQASAPSQNNSDASGSSVQDLSTNPLILTNSAYMLSKKDQGGMQQTMETKLPDVKLSDAERQILFNSENNPDRTNTLVFPDQLDSKDGNIYTTQEPDCTKIKAQMTDDNYKLYQDDITGGNRNDVSEGEKKDPGTNDKPKKKKSKKSTVKPTTEESQKVQEDGTQEDSTKTSKKRNKKDSPKYNKKKDPYDPYSN
ncbi:MAG: hypothetical protein AB1458_07890 [Bacteroidota bacterium]